MTITFGIHIGQQNITVDELRHVWTFADAHGFGWLSIWDHFYCATDDRDPHYEAVALLGALAAETHHLELGCMVFAAPYRNLGLLAKAMITVDHLSGGRLAFGLGAGWHEPEFRAFGYPFLPVKERLDMLDEAMRAMRSFLDHEVTDFHGRYFDFTDAYMNPRPLGRIPLWVGGRGEKRTARIAARYADGWNIPYVSPEGYREKTAALEHWCEVEGRDPAAVKRATQLGFFMAVSDEPVALEAADAEMRRKIPHQDPAGQLTGGPSAVAARIREYQEAGVTALNLALRPPVDRTALEVFVRDVMPLFS